MPKGARTEGGWGTVLPPPATDSTHAARIAKAGIKNSNRRENRSASHTNQRHPRGSSARHPRCGGRSCASIQGTGIHVFY